MTTQYVNFWYVMFTIIVAAFIGLLLYSKDKRYLFYFITGSAVGFYLDFVSVSQGYYTYYQYVLSFLGIPLTVTIAEGCSIAITVFLFRTVVSKILKKGLKK